MSLNEVRDLREEVDGVKKDFSAHKILYAAQSSTFEAVMKSLQESMEEALFILRGDGNGEKGMTSRLNALKFIVDTVLETVNKNVIRFETYEAKLAKLDEAYGARMAELEGKIKHARLTRDGEIVAIKERSRTMRTLIDAAKVVGGGLVGALAAKYGLAPPK